MQDILVIDDDIYIGDMLEEALRKEGYGVSRAYSGTEALLLVGKMYEGGLTVEKSYTKAFEMYSKLK